MSDSCRSKTYISKYLSIARHKCYLQYGEVESKGKINQGIYVQVIYSLELIPMRIYCILKWQQKRDVFFSFLIDCSLRPIWSSVLSSGDKLICLSLPGLISRRRLLEMSLPFYCFLRWNNFTTARGLHTVVSLCLEYMRFVQYY